MNNSHGLTRMKNKQLLLHFITLIMPILSLAAESNRLSAEFGFAQNTYNQVRIPGDDGTKVNLRQSFADSVPYFRIDYKKKFSKWSRPAPAVCPPQA